MAFLTMVTKRKATKRKATGIKGFNVLLSRKYLKVDKPILNLKQRHGRFIRETEFQGEIMQIKENPVLLM